MTSVLNGRSKNADISTVFALEQGKCSFSKGVKALSMAQLTPGDTLSKSKTVFEFSIFSDVIQNLSDF